MAGNSIYGLFPKWIVRVVNIVVAKGADHIFGMDYDRNLNPAPVSTDV